LKYWEDDESIESQEEYLEIRGGGISQPESEENSDDELAEETADSNIDSDNTRTAALDNHGGIGAESSISCLTSAEETAHRIPCPRCSSPSYKPELWFDGPEGTTTLGRCSKCSSLLSFYEAPPSYDDLVGSRLYFEELSWMRQSTPIMV